MPLDLDADLLVIGAVLAGIALLIVTMSWMEDTLENPGSVKAPRKARKPARAAARTVVEAAASLVKAIIQWAGRYSSILQHRATRQP
ncbi:MAG: hypothetical protein ACRDP1_08285 [Nocardioidaceae bacterium]